MLRAWTNTGRFIATHPLTRDHRISVFARFARWQLESRLKPEVVVPWVGGTKPRARRGMAGATGNIYVGLHEFVDMMLTVHCLRPGDLFLDVGANIGSYTILASGVAGALTWAFEPDPGTARDLERNVELNGLNPRVTMHRHALGDSDGEVTFTTGRGTTNRIARAGDQDTQQRCGRRGTGGHRRCAGGSREHDAKMPDPGDRRTVGRGDPARRGIRGSLVRSVLPPLERAAEWSGFEQHDLRARLALRCRPARDRQTPRCAWAHLATCSAGKGCGRFPVTRPPATEMHPRPL